METNNQNLNPASQSTSMPNLQQPQQTSSFQQPIQPPQPQTQVPPQPIQTNFSAAQNPQMSFQLNNLINLLDFYLTKKAPALPPNFKAMIVQYAPWLIILSLIITAPSIIAFFGISAFLIPASYLTIENAGIKYTIYTMLLALSLLAMLIAIPGLFKRSKKGWSFVFYSLILSAAYDLIYFNIGHLIIYTLVSLYLLFQVKEYYT